MLSLEQVKYVVVVILSSDIEVIDSEFKNIELFFIIQFNCLVTLITRIIQVGLQHLLIFFCR
jgi:hypothetical protein